MRHAPGSDGPLHFYRMDEDNKFNGWIKRMHLRTVTSKIRLATRKADVSPLLFLAFQLLAAFVVFLKIHASGVMNVSGLAVNFYLK